MLRPTRPALHLKAIVILTLCAARCSSAPSATERAIREQYDSIERAYAAQDLAAILATRDPALEVVVPVPDGGIEHYAEFEEIMRQWFTKNKPPIEVHYTIESIETLSANEVAVHVLQRASRYQGTTEPLRHVVHEVRQRETWIRTPSGWKVRKIDQIDLAHRKVWENGEAVPLEKQ